MWTSRKKSNPREYGRLNGHFQSVSISKLQEVNIPFADMGLEHYCAQNLAINDCLYRTIGRYRWTFFTDMDEYVVSPYYTSSQRKTYFYERFFHNLTRQFNSQNPSKEKSLLLIPSFMLHNRMICKPPTDCDLPQFPSSCSHFAVSSFKAQCSNSSFCTSSIGSDASQSFPIPDLSDPAFLNFLHRFSPFFSLPSAGIGRSKVVVDPILTNFMFVHHIHMTTISRHAPHKEECQKRTNSVTTSTVSSKNAKSNLHNLVLEFRGKSELEWIDLLYPKTTEKRFVSLLLRSFNGCTLRLDQLKKEIVLPVSLVSCYHLHFQDLPCHSIDTHLLDALGQDLWNCLTNKNSACLL